MRGNDKSFRLGKRHPTGLIHIASCRVRTAYHFQSLLVAKSLSRVGNAFLPTDFVRFRMGKR